ncbi:MAG TPA: serine/threonine-protein kinase, partial [Polyangia bacterium]
MTALLGTMIGSYRLVRLLGSGGMGDVYLGEHPQIRSRVAVKVLHAEHAQERTHVERFLNEARAVNTIRHDNIVKILDLGTLADGRPYLVMEYVDGLSLAHLLRLRGTLPLGGLLRAANDVLAGLAAAHRHLVIHRDLKPDNVYVSAAGRAFVLDFGLAKLVGEQGTIVLTRKGTWLGTPYYMAPEQIAGGKTDGRTDLYALGVILYQGVTGRLPFDAPEIDEIFRRHLTMTPPPPRALRPDLPAAVEALILRALEKDPARRCGSAKEMAALLAPARAALGAAAGSDNLADLVGATAFPGAPGPAPAPAATPAPAARGVAYQSTTASAPAVAPAAGLAYQSTVASAPALAPAALPYQATVAGAPALAPPPGLPYQATVASAPALAPPYQATMASGAAAALPYQATVASAAAGPAPFVAPTDRGARPRARRGPLIAVIAGGAVALIAVAGVGGYLVARAGEDAAPTRAPAAGRPPRGTAAGAGKAPSSKEPIVTRRPGS